jgi:hypothetical protein
MLDFSERNFKKVPVKSLITNDLGARRGGRGGVSA